MQELISLAIPWWQIILRTAIVYVVIAGGLRVVGKREIGQMTIIDFVVLLLLANSVQNAMVGPDTSLAGGLLAAATLLGMEVLLSRLATHFPPFRHWLEGTPTLLVLHGKPIPAHLRKEGIDDEILQAALREHGISSLAEVATAVLEIDGTISIVPETGTTKRSKHPLRPFRRL